MKKLFLTFTLFVFCMSPMAFGANMNAAQLYKDTYIQLKQGKPAGQVLNNLIATAKSNKIDMKEVLESAVTKGYISQEQLNSALDVMQKNSGLAKDASIVAKAKSGGFSDDDVAALTTALQGQMTGAPYYCGRYGCYHSRVYFAPAVVLLLVVLLLTPVIVVG